MAQTGALDRGNRGPLAVGAEDGDREWTTGPDAPRHKYLPLLSFLVVITVKFQNVSM